MKISSVKELVIKQKVTNKKTLESMYIDTTIEEIVESGDTKGVFFNLYGVSIAEVQSGEVTLPSEITDIFPDTHFTLNAEVVKGKDGSSDYVRASFRPKARPVNEKTLTAFHALYAK